MCQHCEGHDTAEVSFVLRNEAGKATEIKFSYKELEEFAKQTIENTNELVEKLSPSLVQMMED